MSPRKATGIYEERAWKDGRTVSYGARVRHEGRQVRLLFGTNHEGWSEQRARNELERIVAQVERGTWTPPGRQATTTSADRHGNDKEFLTFLYQWWQAKKLELTPRGREDYVWRMGHLKDGPLASLEVRGIDKRAVDAERTRLLEAGLGARSVNMVLMLLAQVLDDAVEQDVLEANPARGRRRRVKEPPVRRPWLEPDQARDLIDAAGELEAEARPSDRYGRRAIVATLLLAGPRVTELTQANRANLDLHGGLIKVGSKTEAGIDRHVDLTWHLQSELRNWVATGRPEMGGPLFPTRNGNQHSASNIRRLLRQCRERANTNRAERGEIPIGTVTPHACRRTFATLSLMAGRDARYVMGQLGHADARLTLSIYAQVMNRRNFDRATVTELMRFPDEVNETAIETMADRERIDG